MEKLIGVIGGSSVKSEVYQFSYKLGIALGELDYSIVNGGKGGVMEAIGKGFTSVKKTSGRILCIIPSDKKNEANEFCHYVIPSGLGIGRNILIVRSADILIAIDGGAGTLSEISMAWQYGKRVLCVEKFGGWSKSLANVKLDNKHRENLLIPVNSIEEIINKIRDYL